MAESIPCEDTIFSAVYSVEAAQHFHSIPRFCHEAYRVLRPRGRVAISTFFAPTAAALAELPRLLRSVRDGTDRIVTIDVVRDALCTLRFSDMVIELIGAQIFPAFDAYICQEEGANTWARNWYQAYKSDLLDYYLITAKKPA